MDDNDGEGIDCPYQVEIHGTYGTCDCNGENYDECCADI